MNILAVSSTKPSRPFHSDGHGRKHGHCNGYKKSPLRKFHLSRGRTVTAKAVGFLFRVRDDDQDREESYAAGDFDGLVIGDKYLWEEELKAIRSMEDQLSNKRVFILGINSPEDFMPPSLVEVIELRDTFMQSGAKSVDYVHYEDAVCHFKSPLDDLL